MTIATGKGGRYYKCTSKINVAGKKECENSNVRMETLDRLVLQTVAEKVITHGRVEMTIEGLRVNLKKLIPIMMIRFVIYRKSWKTSNSRRINFWKLWKMVFSL